MEKSNLDREWNFIATETHKKFKRADSLKREILFALQILLSKAEVKNYFALKEEYIKNN